MSGVDAWGALLTAFLPLFTRPGSAVFVRLASAWVLCIGRHTLTRIYHVAEPKRERAHDAYPRFFRSGAWLMAELWETLAHVLVAAFYPQGPLPLALDDTAFHKSGRKIEGAGWWRDAVRSSGTKVVHCFGLNVIVLTLQVQPPWEGEPIGLPVNMRLHRKKQATLLDLAEEMLREFSGWFIGRTLSVCADGFYASLAGRDVPGMVLTCRMRKDAALYKQLTKPVRRKRGRPRQKGLRLPAPEHLARTKTGWKQVPVSLRGKQVDRLVWSMDVVWWAVCPDRPVRLVISRDPLGVEADDFFFTTDLTAAPETVITLYANRWAIEDTFKNVKQFLGAEDPQCWKEQGPERVAAFSFWLYSMVWCWYLRVHGRCPAWTPLPWYTQKRTPSFMDALSTLRTGLWREKLFSMSDKPSVIHKINHYCPV